MITSFAKSKGRSSKILLISSLTVSKGINLINSSRRPIEKLKTGPAAKQTRSTTIIIVKRIVSEKPTIKPMIVNLKIAEALLGLSLFQMI